MNSSVLIKLEATFTTALHGTCLPSRAPGVTPGFSWGPCCSSFRFSVLCVFCFVLLCLSSSCVLCNPMLLFSLDSPFLRFSLTLSSVFCVVICAMFVFVLCLVHTMLPVSLDCPFVIASPSVLSNIYVSQAQNDYPSGILTSILFMSFGFIAPKTLNYLAFQSFDLERT